MRIHDALQMWAEWQGRYRHNYGAPSHACGIGGAGQTCWDDISESVDSWICQCVETAVNDLPSSQKAAIQHRYQSRRLETSAKDYADNLNLALDTLTIGLRNKGVDVPANEPETRHYSTLDMAA